MVDGDGNAYDADDYVVGIKVYSGSKVYPYSEALYNELYASTGGQCCKLYAIAKYATTTVGSCTTKQYVITTDSNGDAVTGELMKSYENSSGETVYCKYSILEYTTPYPYVLPYEFTVSSNGFTTTVFQNVVLDEETSTAWLETTNEEMPGSLKIYKYDAVTAEALEGIVFNIYTDISCKNLYTTVTTDSDGEAYTENMPVGTYYVKEASAQSGYQAYGGVETAVITADTTTEIDLSNTPWTVNISITKVLDTDSLPAGQDENKYSLGGAKFGLYARDNIAGANGKLLYEADELITTLTTDANGYAAVDAAWAKKNLRLGSYYIKELEAPEGFLLSDAEYDIDATKPTETDTESYEEYDIDEYTTGTVLYRSVTIKESLETTPIKITKTGEVKFSDEETLLSGAVFRVYDLDAMEAAGIAIEDITTFDFLNEAYDAYRVIINSSEDTPYVIVTDENGEAQTTALMDGNYAVVESAAPYGYDLAAPKLVTLPEEAVEEDSGEEAAAGTEEAAAVTETADAVTVSITDELLLGSIEIIKLGDSLSGYNEIDTIYGTVNRLIFEKKPLAGVEFTIYHEGTAIGTVTTNSEGYAKSSGLPVGTYTVVETKTPAGMILDSTEYELTITANGTEVINPQLSVTNDVMSAELAVYKTGETIEASEDDAFNIGRIPLEGVIFGVYNATDLLDNNGNVVLPAGSCVGISKTGEDGEAVIKECLVPGNYYYKEVQALEGYVLDEEEHAFTLQLTQNTEVERVELNKESPLLNKFYKARVELLKIDADMSEVHLAGAVFGLYNADTDELYGKYTTGEDGYIVIEEMPYGSWYFMELEAPAGYILDDTHYDFEITEEDTDSVIRIAATNRSTPKLGFDDNFYFSIFAILGAILLVLGIICMAAGIYLLCRDKRESTKEERGNSGRRKKKTGSLLIAAACFFLIAVVFSILLYKKDSPKEQAADTITSAYLTDPGNIEENTEEEYDYSGIIDCVLQIPKIDMERVVITGGDMDYNLDRHLFVTLQSSMRYGECSYIVCGHQSYIYGYSMNRLEELEVGDEIYITKDDVTDTFTVTEKCMEQWGINESDYGDDPDKLAIYTCRKQQVRPQAVYCSTG